MPKKTTKTITPYRPRKKVVEDLAQKGEISEMEAQQLNNAVEIADKAKVRGKYFLDLEKYIGARKQELQEAIDKGKLSENQKKMLHTIEVAQIEKPLLSSPMSIANAISKYMQVILEDGNKPTVNGLALALGISKGDLFNIASGKKVYVCGICIKGEAEIKQALQVIATTNELDIANSGGMGAIFLGKNYFGYKDEQKISIADESKDLTKEEIDDKYKDIDVIDIE